jgi:hypothetical protein
VIQGAGNPNVSGVLAGERAVAEGACRFGSSFPGLQSRGRELLEPGGAMQLDFLGQFSLDAASPKEVGQTAE